MINPEGSTGQGQDFTDAVRNSWGDKPFRTLMLGMDYVYKTYVNLTVKHTIYFNLL